MTNMKLRSLRQNGFTIIELMIATAVLSTILLLVTVLMINIGNLYYKGINQARVQDDVRSISDEVSQHLRLGDAVIAATAGHLGPNGEQAYCIGADRYTYVVGVQIGVPDSDYKHALWRDDNPSAGTCDATGVNLKSTSPTTGRHGTELIAPRSRLINFSITGASPYDVKVGVAYGDNDLLCSPSVAGSCASDAAMPSLSDYTHGDLLCKGRRADQFCATAKLNTGVVRRLP